MGPSVVPSQIQEQMALGWGQKAAQKLVRSLTIMRVT